MSEPTFYRAAATRGFVSDPDADTVVGQAGQVVDAGPYTEMRRAHGAPTVTRELHGQLLLPGLINAHTHLELTAIGPQPYGGDFVGWIRMLQDYVVGLDTDGAPRQGAHERDPRAPAGCARAAAGGAREAAAAGVQAVGDIARFDTARAARIDAGLGGTTFIELFGLGPPHDAAALARIGEPADGFQPHAPYSAGPALFAAAAASGRPVCTHLAETPEEAQFVAQGSGPFRDLLETMGKWEPGFARAYGGGASPVQWLAPALQRASWLLAHGNYLNDADIALLAETRASVAYCPVASDYFGHRRHRYRDLLAAGVNVCLGTDSVVCQPPDTDPTQWLSVLPQMRYLHRRDGTDPSTLLGMATTCGRRALGLSETVTRLCAVRISDNSAGDLLAEALGGDAPGRGISLGAELASVAPK